MESPLTPLALAERGFLLYPSLPAVLDDGLMLTYRDLQRQIETLAGGLKSIGVKPGDRVALLAPNTAEAFCCYTAVPLAEAVLVPMNTRLARDDYAHILDHSETRALILHPSLRVRIDPVLKERPHVRVVAMGEPEPGETAFRDLVEGPVSVPIGTDGIDEDGLISLNYTSGTTARPKGVMLTHRNTYVNAINMILAMNLDRGQAHLHVAPMFHANGWGFVWATLGVGAANVMVPQPGLDPQDVLRRIDAFDVTSFTAASTVLLMLLEAGRRTSHRPRVAVAGAQPPAGVIRRVEDELGYAVTHLYGLTETTAFITRCEVPPEVDRRDPGERAAFKSRQGVPLPLAGRVRVVDDEMTDVRRDGETMGEVVARGNVVMKGYFRDEEATREALQGGWFHTGDLAVWFPDGSIALRDRKKDIIISGGENISSLEVEGVLYTHPDVAQAAVVSAPDPFWGETPVAFVAPRRGHSVDPEGLIAYCRDHLTHFKVPRRVVVVEDLPRTASGKIRKVELRAGLREDGGRKDN